MDRYGLVGLNHGVGTHMPPRGQTTPIDLSMCSSGLSKRASWSILGESFGSDHFPIVIKFDGRANRERVTRESWNLEKANWDEYRRVTKIALEKLPPFARCQDAWKAMSEALHEAASISIPLKRRGREGLQPVPWWNEAIAAVIKARNRACNALKRGYSQEKLEAYRQLKKEAQAAVRDAKINHWRRFCSSLNSHSKLGDMWKAVKSINGTQSRFSVPALKNDRETVFTDKGKADMIAQTISWNASDANLLPEFVDLKAADKERILYALQASVLENDDVHGLNANITRKELEEALLKCSKGKSPGPDGICYEMLKEIGSSGLDKLLEFINLSWAKEEVPDMWRESTVVPLLKPGKDPSDPNSYRPISLTSALCKLAERIIANNIRN